MSRRSKLCARTLSVATFAVAANTAHAIDYYWQGGTGTSNPTNYPSVAAPPPVPPNVAPGVAPTDYVFIGGGTDTTASAVTSSATFPTGHIRIGTLSTAG